MDSHSSRLSDDVSSSDDSRSVNSSEYECKDESKDKDDRSSFIDDEYSENEDEWGKKEDRNTYSYSEEDEDNVFQRKHAPQRVLRKRHNNSCNVEDSKKENKSALLRKARGAEKLGGEKLGGACTAKRQKLSPSTVDESDLPAPVTEVSCVSPTPSPPTVTSKGSCCEDTREGDVSVVCVPFGCSSTTGKESVEPILNKRQSDKPRKMNEQGASSKPMTKRFAPKKHNGSTMNLSTKAKGKKETDVWKDEVKTKEAPFENLPKPNTSETVTTDAVKDKLSDMYMNMFKTACEGNNGSHPISVYTVNCMNRDENNEYANNMCLLKKQLKVRMHRIVKGNMKNVAYGRVTSTGGPVVCVVECPSNEKVTEDVLTQTHNKCSALGSHVLVWVRKGTLGPVMLYNRILNVMENVDDVLSALSC